MQALGFNYRITDIQCALGLSQLERLDGWVARRNEIARPATATRWRARSGSSCRPPRPRAPCTDTTCSRSGCATAPRRACARSRRCGPAGIGVQVHYIPVYRLPYYRDTLGYPQDECPHAEELYSGLISLPMFPGMDEGDVGRVVEELGRALP